MRGQTVKAQAERPGNPRPSDVRVRGVGVLDAAHFRDPGRPLDSGNVARSDGRTGGGELDSTSDSGDQIERYRTAAILVSTAAVLAGYLVIQYLDLVGAR